MPSLSASSDVGTATQEHAIQPAARRKRKRKQSDQTKQESLGGAIVRSLFGTLAFLFKRPVRLFRPVKLSSWTILEAMAKREGRSGLSIRYLRSLIRRESASFLPHLLLPPLLFNTAIGFTLFEAYSMTESRLLAKAKRPAHDPQTQTEHKPEWTPLWIVTISGAVAGAAQCFLSAPLDNVRYIMQQNVSPHSGSHGRHRTGSHNMVSKRISNISWRAILRAAILPFAPAIARDRLVQAVHHDTIKSSTTPTRTTMALDKLRSTVLGQSSATKRQQRFGLSPEKRQEWEKRLKRWRGGIHGSGLALSLIRDSVGFGSFFCIFEVSRRCAFYASTSIDRLSALINGRGLGIAMPSSAGQDHDMHSQDVDTRSRDVRTNNEDADFSYNQSRTVQGRVVAVVILLIGGAFGALSYELVGRPFELMRVVIWQGRKQWEQGKREPQTHTHHHKTKKSKMRPTRYVRQSLVNAPRWVRPLPRANHDKRSRFARHRHRSHTPPAPNQPNPQAKSAELRKRRSANAEPRPSHGRNRSFHPAKRRAAPDTPISADRHPAPTLATRPGALTLLLEHARSTIQMDKKYGAPDASRMSAPRMLAHTYFIAPFLPEIPKVALDNQLVREAAGVNKQLHPTNKQASNTATPTFTTVAQRTLHMSLASRRRAVAESPENKVRRTWVRNNPVNSSFASKHPRHGAGGASTVLTKRGGQGASDHSTLQRGTRYWASGRVSWALKRLATPYGVAFLVFAWLSGDLN